MELKDKLRPNTRIKCREKKLNAPISCIREAQHFEINEWPMANSTDAAIKEAVTTENQYK